MHRVKGYEGTENSQWVHEGSGILVLKNNLEDEQHTDEDERTIPQIIWVKVKRVKDFGSSTQVRPVGLRILPKVPRPVGFNPHPDRTSKLPRLMSMYAREEIHKKTSAQPPANFQQHTHPKAYDTSTALGWASATCFHRVRQPPDSTLIYGGNDSKFQCLVGHVTGFRRRRYVSTVLTRHTATTMRDLRGLERYMASSVNLIGEDLHLRRHLKIQADAVFVLFLVHAVDTHIRLVPFIIQRDLSFAHPGHSVNHASGEHLFLVCCPLLLNLVCIPWLSLVWAVAAIVAGWIMP
ncbi:hypothetical protein DFH08DRAFT_826465 [Mycena albidolilacea]|uniref:Uncharacterized protein n=1 Tax=Mycena albidolilacea TaxID=1033008 RepID=A0AAD6YZZ0_9AGAR|nr:hypothetical protein DFH08DRAFT_826465 [Mycena albidolilacea]